MGFLRTKLPSLFVAFLVETGEFRCVLFHSADFDRSDRADDCQLSLVFQLFDEIHGPVVYGVSFGQGFQEVGVLSVECLCEGHRAGFLAVSLVSGEHDDLPFISLFHGILDGDGICDPSVKHRDSVHICDR